MAGAGPMTARGLARKTSLNERYLQKWFSAQAAGNFLEYDAGTRSFTLTNEYAEILANEAGPAFFPAAFEIMKAMFIDEPRLEEAFKTGEGVGWDEHHPCLFSGTERFFKPSYLMNLIQSWLPSLNGTVNKLQKGCARGGRRLRTWGINRHHGAGLCQFTLLGIRLPRRLD